MPNGNNGYGGATDPGGPDQNMVEIYANVGSLRFAQSNRIRKGDLVRWKVTVNFLPAGLFTVFPGPKGWPLMAGAEGLTGQAGRTPWMQVLEMPKGTREEFEFRIKIDGRDIEGIPGFMSIEGVESLTSMATTKKQPKKPTNKQLKEMKK
jgi:hypothetical protein